MKSSTVIASTLASAALVGAIGLAYAQTASTYRDKDTDNATMNQGPTRTPSSSGNMGTMGSTTTNVGTPSSTVNRSAPETNLRDGSATGMSNSGSNRSSDMSSSNNMNNMNNSTSSTGVSTPMNSSDSGNTGGFQGERMARNDRN